MTQIPYPREILANKTKFPFLQQLQGLRKQKKKNLKKKKETFNMSRVMSVIKKNKPRSGTRHRPGVLLWAGCASVTIVS